MPGSRAYLWFIGPAIILMRALQTHPSLQGADQ